MGSQYKFVNDEGTEQDWKFYGLIWELDTYQGEQYMDGGQFSIKVDNNLRSLSSRTNRQGVFVKISD